MISPSLSTPSQSSGSWDARWRQAVWSQITGPWDLVIIGGGVTGAGILREASRLGLRALLLEGRDFASGTSSRSSKLVHGGLRYLKNAQIRVTLESVSERERLLREGKGLINRLGFLFAHLEGDVIPGWLFGLGLVIYDLMAMNWSHRHYRPDQMRAICPPLTTPQLVGGYRYFDALTDDARLVFRLIREAVQDGATALNYASVESLLRTRNGQVCGVVVADRSAGFPKPEVEIMAPVVINATGAWGDRLRGRLGLTPKLRLLRGSHLILPSERLPLSRAVSLLHPMDGRPVYAIPWEGVTLVGTTDVDQGTQIPMDPAISASEVDYLLGAVSHVFPDLEVTPRDIQATYAGIRAVVGSGKTNPSSESREHVVWYENGLLTVSGGKLTTFRLIAHQAIQAISRHLPVFARIDRRQMVLDPLPMVELPKGVDLTASSVLRLAGRYGIEAPTLIAAAHTGELAPIPNTPYLWAELRWAAQAEGVVHLDDLLLRRIRIGLLLPQGGRALMEQLREVVQAELGWGDARWEQEMRDYTNLWYKSYNASY